MPKILLDNKVLSINEVGNNYGFSKTFLGEISDFRICREIQTTFLCGPIQYTEWRIGYRDRGVCVWGIEKKCRNGNEKAGKAKIDDETV